MTLSRRNRYPSPPAHRNRTHVPSSRYRGLDLEPEVVRFLIARDSRQERIDQLSSDLDLFTRAHDAEIESFNQERAQISRWYEDAVVPILRARNAALRRRLDWTVSKRVDDGAQHDDSDDDARDQYHDDTDLSDDDSSLGDDDWVDTELFPYEEDTITRIEKTHIFRTVSSLYMQIFLHCQLLLTYSIVMEQEIQRINITYHQRMRNLSIFKEDMLTVVDEKISNANISFEATCAPIRSELAALRAEHVM